MIHEISFSKLEERLDAEFYQPKYMAIMDTLRKYPETNTLHEVCRSIKSFGAYSLYNLIHYEESGIPFIRVINLKEDEIDFTDVKYISKKTHDILNKSKVSEGMVLLSMAGTLGIAATVPKGFKECNSNQDIAKLVVCEEVNPYYLSTFLNSRFGRNQVFQVATGSTRRHTLLYAIKNIVVAIPSRKTQNEIAEKVISASEMRSQAYKLYSQAEKELYDILHVDLSHFTPQETFETTSSEIFESMRFDAEYYKPSLFRYTIKVLKESGFEVKKLKDTVDIYKRMTDPRKDPEKIIKYIELSDINRSTGEIEGFSEISGHQAPSRARLVLKKGDVLVPSLKGSLDNVALVPSKFDGAIGSTGFFVIRSEIFQEEYLFRLFRSRLVKEQLEQKVAGTIMAAISKNDLENLLVPVVSSSQQNNISNLVKEYLRLREKALRLIRAAKRDVESLVNSGQV